MLPWHAFSVGAHRHGHTERYGGTGVWGTGAQTCSWHPFAPVHRGSGARRRTGVPLMSGEGWGGVPLELLLVCVCVVPATIL